LPTRDLAWPSCFNARDLGGYATADGRRTRWRAAIRADNMSHLTAEGRAALVRDGVRTVVDLRSPFELRIDRPPFAPPGAPPGAPAYRNLPVLDGEDPQLAEEIEACGSTSEMYVLMLDRCRLRLAAIVAAVAEAPEGGAVFHCHAGLDRTGLVAALLLAAVGVPAGTIADDYALSEARLGAFYEHYRARIADPDERARYRRPTAPREPILAALAHLDAAHGGAEAYLRSAGVTDAELARLRERLVE
jgi:protein-tyrosine phosphatase